MNESLGNTDKHQGLTRRKFLENAVGGLAATGALAGASGNANAMGALRWLTGAENDEQLKNELADKLHAARVYMARNNGELEKNLKRLGQEIGTKMLDGTYEAIPERKRDVAQKNDMKPIFDERNDILERLDAELIPELLVLYIQNGIEDKSLVRVYRELGGDVEAVRKSGIAGVDGHLVDEIMSEIRYSIGSVRGHANYAIPDYSALSFKKREPNLQTRF